MLSFIDNIFPYEKDKSLPCGNCNINISLSSKIFLLYLNKSGSILKKFLIPSDSNNSIHV